MILSNPREISSAVFPKKGSFKEKMYFLLHFAILAPSNMNSQPWKFKVEDTVIFYPDQNRWLKVSDPDQRELFISLGCALENFLIAAHHFGFQTTVRYLADYIEVHLKEAFFERQSPLFPCITRRFTYRGKFRKKRVPSYFFKEVINPSFSLYVSANTKQICKIQKLSNEADRFRFNNSKYREELLENIPSQRFERNIADILSSKGFLQKAPYIAVLKTIEKHPISWMKGGQLLERLYLTAFSRGICILPFSNILEVPSVKKKFCKKFRLKQQSILQTFYIGYPEEIITDPFSSRDCLDQKIV